MLRLLARVIGVGIETADMLVQEDARPTIITVIPGLVFGIIYWFLAWLIAGRATDSEGASVRKLRHRKQFVGIGLPQFSKRLAGNLSQMNDLAILLRLFCLSEQ